MRATQLSKWQHDRPDHPDADRPGFTSKLHLISDRNLISARYHGIELDIEDACAVLDLGAQTSAFREILLHSWPEPQDPVVVALLASARRALGHIASLDGPSITEQCMWNHGPSR
jgi:hypothetical protein